MSGSKKRMKNSISELEEDDTLAVRKRQLDNAMHMPFPESTEEERQGNTKRRRSKVTEPIDNGNAQISNLQPGDQRHDEGIDDAVNDDNAPNTGENEGDIESVSTITTDSGEVDEKEETIDDTPSLLDRSSASFRAYIRRRDSLCQDITRKNLLMSLDEASKKKRDMSLSVDSRERWGSLYKYLKDKWARIVEVEQEQEHA